MALYKPCQNCAVDAASCQTRQKVRAAISGLGVTSIKFACKERKPMFHPGQRVAFKWAVYGETGEYWDAEKVQCEFHATVMKEKGLRFIVRVDDGPDHLDGEISAKDTFNNDNLVIKVKPSDMKALGQPDVAICQVCAKYEGEKGCHGYGSKRDLYSYWPDECLRINERPE